MRPPGPVDQFVAAFALLSKKLPPAKLVTRIKTELFFLKGVDVITIGILHVVGYGTASPLRSCGFGLPTFIGSGLMLKRFKRRAEAPLPPSLRQLHSPHSVRER